MINMSWNYHRDSQGRNVYQVNEPSPHDYCMCSLHARNSVSLSSLSSLNLSSPSPSPPDGPLMLSMQYSGHYVHNRPTTHKKSSYNKSYKSSSNRNRRLSGTFIPEHHIISMPVKSKVKSSIQIYNRPL